MLSQVHVVKQDIEGIHRHLVWGDWEERCCLELYSWGVEVLTTIDRVFVCRVWNKQLLVVTPKRGVSWCVCVCVCVCVGGWV